MTPEARAVEEYSRIRIERDRAHGADVVVIGGDVDLHSAPELREQLERVSNEDSSSRIVVDLSEATFLDSMALGVLLAAKRSADGRGKRFVIVAATTEIRRIFEITMLDSVFELRPTREEALEDGDGLGA
jgi:anti-anti-sigma factor